MSRRDPPRGGGALKVISALLVVMVLLFFYVAWQKGYLPTDIPAFLVSIPMYVYIALLSLSAVIAASLAREGFKMRAKSRTSRSAGGRSAATAPRSDSWPMPPERPGRVVIDFVPVTRAPSKDMSTGVGASTEDLPGVVAQPNESTRPGPVVNEWPTEAVPLGKPPQERGAKAPPAVESHPLSVTAAIPEPWLGPELESGPESAAGAPVDVTPVNAPPDTLLGRLMNWLDETAPEAVTKRRARRSAKKGR